MSYLVCNISKVLFLIWLQPKLICQKACETESPPEALHNQEDSAHFKGDICGPVAETINEEMFNLVICRWRETFEGLKQTNDYKTLSAAGSLMKNMVSTSGGYVPGLDRIGFLFLLNQITRIPN